MNVATQRVFRVATKGGSGKLFSSVSTRLLDGTEEYPGLPNLTHTPKMASQASISTLPNGLIVVSEDACSTSTVTMTYPNAGSASEYLGEEGAALINKCLAFRSGSGLSTALINRTIENEGATPFAKADRTSATFGYTVEPNNALGLIPLLATDCTFEKWDVRDAKKLAKFQIDEANKSVEVVLTEQIYAAFCTEVDSLLAESPKSDTSPSPVASYLGGEARLSAPSIGYAHVALAFEVKDPSPIRKILKHCFGQIGKESGLSTFETGGMVGVYAFAPTEGVSTLETAITETLTTKLTSEVILKAKILAKAEATFDLDCGSIGLATALTAAVMETGTFTD